MLWGAALAFTLSVIALVITLRIIWGFPFATDKIHFGSAIFLLLLTLILFFRYLTTPHYEMGVVAKYLDRSAVPAVRPKVYYLISSLAISFGILLSVSDNVLLFSAVMVHFNLVDMWANWEVNKELRRLIDPKLTDGRDSVSKEIVQILDRYYFENPILPRIAAILFVNWIAVSLAVVAFYEDESLSIILRNTAYAVLYSNIIASEIVISRWRKKRDLNIKKAEQSR